MVKIKTQEEIRLMAEGGRILSKILAHLVKKAQPGISTLQLDREAEEKILASGGQPSFKMVPGYKFATCLCVNDAVVHGLPTNYKLKEGDILGIDVGIFYKGFHTDAAWTVIIEHQLYKPIRRSIIKNKESRIKNNGKKRFLEVGEEALERAINVAREGNHVGDISKAIQETVEGAGYSVVRSLVGHGIGQKLHEDPQVPGFLTRKVDKTPLLISGMTLAIEVIYNMGRPEVIYKDDGWTVATKDGKLSGLFEKTVVVTKKEPIVLTP